jgi:nitric oxide reductase activation protein
MKYFSFIEETTLPTMNTHFEDLARILCKNPDLHVERSLLSYCDLENQTITMSSFWDTYLPSDQSLGIKSDIYLRTLGNMAYTDWSAVQKFITATWQFPKLAKNLFTLCEDIRLENMIKNDRKGTEKVFRRRREILGSYCKVQMPSQILRNAVSNVFLLLAMLDLLGLDIPVPLKTDYTLPAELAPIVNLVTTMRGQMLELVQYEEIERQLGKLARQDITIDLFTMAVNANLHTKPDRSFDALTREKKIANLEQNDEETAAAPSEKQETWHRETRHKSGTGLQMKLEHGTQSRQHAHEARLTTETPNDVSAMHGKSNENERDNDLPRTTEDEERLQTEETFVSQNGDESTEIPCVVVHAPPFTENDEETYSHWLTTLSPIQKRFVRVIQRYIAFKQTESSSWKSIGRVGKSLTHLTTEGDPRIFVKREEPSRKKDAAFHILVDCSGSMYDKLEKVKEVVTLCHETFAELLIPHAVSGFWEENIRSIHNKSTMYMLEAIPFQACFQPSIGLNITSLKPQLDNRDGYAIRYAANQLTRRNEQYKFLLMFSDGDPAADGYTSYGISDTQRAVKWSMKRRIPVIHFFVTNGPISNNTMLALNQMYGKNSILIDEPSSMVKRTEAVLRRLLYRVL